ncbi:hypothetical protein GF339_04880 [candidate division KSB3 bacterium]|uniref:Exostosin GT47 domain-containing protein n=1 Tax=candidate division KSB3 bacterium TaxID=2044937 RepID=A0A9D5Q4T7_9BACT|nr:hypothetical protein [candidate division KSB3 bacterium]MBD3323895.1 hypothetical protein [candidate division KSB3 bacterium]
MTRPLKLYVNPQLVDNNLSYTPFLFPFWQPIIKETTPFSSAVWKQYAFDTSCYGLVDEAAEADFILLPHRYWLLRRKNPDLLHTWVTEAHKTGKPLLIDAHGDSDADVPIDHAYILRTSQYRFKLQPNEIILPVFAEDLLAAYDGETSAAPRPKRTPPRIGFVGWADFPLKQSWKIFLKSLFYRCTSWVDHKYALFTPGVVLRKQILRSLARSDAVIPNFLIRKTFSGHTSTMSGDAHQLRIQFITNILESEYSLAVKGNGNFSRRFYEILSLGRIPLFIDTACVLPLEAIIDYHECCLFVDYHDLHRLDAIIAEFHKQLSPDAFLEMQQKARDIFETYLRVDAFMPYLRDELFRKLETHEPNA